MRKVNIKKLSPGNKVAKTVFTKDGMLLLEKGIILTERYLEKLEEYFIEDIFIAVEEVNEDFIMNLISEESKIEATTILKNIVLESINGPVKQFKEVEGMKGVLKRIIYELVEKPQKLIKFMGVKNHDNYTYDHSVNVCILSLITGIAMKYSFNDLHNLGLAALLHDIGKMVVEAKVTEKKGKYDREDILAMQKHPEFGFEIINSFPAMRSEVAEIVYQHHERYDGSGYPRGLKGDNIHRSARILAIADVFDALINNRTHRKAYLPHEAIEYFYGSGNYLFDYDLVNIFSTNFDLYPVGTKVKLSSGELGEVIEVDKNYNTRPKVKIITDNNTNIKDLSQYPTLMITEVLNESENM